MVANVAFLAALTTSLRSRGLPGSCRSRALQGGIFRNHGITIGAMIAVPLLNRRRVLRHRTLAVPP